MDGCGIRESKTLDNMGTVKFEKKIESRVIGMTRGTKSSLIKTRSICIKGKTTLKTSIMLSL
jgi:hypothetical protein